MFKHYINHPGRLLIPDFLIDFKNFLADFHVSRYTLNVMKKFDIDGLLLLLVGVLACVALFLGALTMFKRSFAKTSNIHDVDSSSVREKADQLQSETSRQLQQQKRENEQKMRDYRTQQRMQKQKLRSMQRNF